MLGLIVHIFGAKKYCPKLDRATPYRSAAIMFRGRAGGRTPVPPAGGGGGGGARVTQGPHVTYEKNFCSFLMFSK